MTIIEMFEAQVAKSPDQMAISFENTVMTYTQLNIAANRLAHYLQEQGVVQETLIGLLLPRSIELFVALLAILKAGGAYIPLDPRYPNQRLNFMMEDSKAPIVLTNSTLQKLLSDNYTGSCIFLDQETERLLTYPTTNVLLSCCVSSQLAYVIYTSGTTGQPKGVMIEHRSVCNLVSAQQRLYNSTDYERVLQFASIAFDTSVWEWAHTLSYGGMLCIISDEARLDPESLAQFILKNRISIATLPPNVLSQLTVINFPALRILSLAGEVSSEKLIENCLKNIPIVFNSYGPTESTVCATMYRYTCGDDARLIGYAIDNVYIRVLDNNLNIVSPGRAGELYIGGIGVARGYLNRLDLTQERFIQDPIDDVEGKRLYRTGDLVRYLDNGNLEFLGRTDQQVKIRGQRVEITEIEYILSLYPTIIQAAVILHTKNDNEKQLVSFLVSTHEDRLCVKEIRSFLATKLPEYMLPTTYIVLPSLPLTTHGKIDRSALPNPDNHSGILSTSRQSVPQTQIEHALALICSELLQIPLTNFSLDDSFFTIGGHSLLVTQLMYAINNKFNVNLSMTDFFSTNVLRELANIIETDMRNKNSVLNEDRTTIHDILSDPGNRYEEFPLTKMQEAYWLGRDTAYDLSDVGVHGYSEYDCISLDISRLELAWNKLINRHDNLRLIFQKNGYQKILKNVPRYQIKRIDLRSLNIEEQIEQLAKIREKLSHQIFHSDEWPLFEVCAAILESHTRLYISIDGLIIDAWSAQIVFKEWDFYYQNPCGELPELTLSFRDYVIAERSLYSSSLYLQHKNYWLDKVNEFPAFPRLPLLKTPKKIQLQHFKRTSKEIDRKQWLNSKSHLEQINVTPTGFLLTVLTEVLYYWSQQDQFSITLTLFSRLPLHPQINQIAGDFTTIILFGANYSNYAHTTFQQRCTVTNQTLWSDLENRLFTGIDFLRELAHDQKKMVSELTSPIVFTSILSEQDEVYTASFMEKNVYSITQTPQIWLDCKAYIRQGNLVIEWDYVEDLFPPNLIEDMHQTYCEILLNLMTSPHFWQAKDPLTLPLRQQTIRDKVNDTNWEYEPKLLHELFHEAALKYPDRNAVIDQTTIITYSKLQHDVCKISGKLHDLGASSNQLIAVILSRSWMQVLACLSINTAGLAYVPIDPELPTERIKYLLDVCQVKVVITEQQLSERFIVEKITSPQRTILIIDRLNIDNLAENNVVPIMQSLDDLAYVIFTSGSTGQPKGVKITHRSVVNTILDINDRYQVTAMDSVLSVSNLNFDLSVYDIFGLLAVGGTVVILNEHNYKDPRAWFDLIKTHRISLWNSVPMFMQMFVEYLYSRYHDLPAQTCLRLILLSGDKIPVSLPSEISICFGSKTTLISLGGATEASIWSIIYPIKNSETSVLIPYGKPMRNQHFHILGACGQALPEWVIGDLYIGGMGISVGYWRSRKLTQQSFVVHPTTQERLYRTGDLGYYLPDGNIIFVGRKDFQVKISGYRIELGEIEANLMQHCDIFSAVVNVIHATTDYLVAYVIPQYYRELPNEVRKIDYTGYKLERFTQKSNECVRLLPRFFTCNHASYFNRKSYRQFLPHDISIESTELFAKFIHKFLMESNLVNPTIQKHNTPLAIFLEAFAAIRDENNLLPKYLYPSSGGLYPIKLILSIQSEYMGVEPGDYLYLPEQHGLQKTTYISSSQEGDLPVFDARLYFLVDIAALRKFYPDYWQYLIQLEMGYMLGACHNFSENSGLTYAISEQSSNMKGEVENLLTLDISLRPNDIKIYPNKVPVFCGNIYFYVKHNEFNTVWYLLNSDGTLYKVSEDCLDIFYTQDMNYSVLYQSKIAIFFSEKLNDEVDNSSLVAIGILAQHLLNFGQENLLGFCPIGGFDSSIEKQLSCVMKDQKILHALFGGYIESTHRESREPSLAEPGATLFARNLHVFLKAKLPNHMLPKVFQTISSIPLSANGKIDRSALPIPEYSFDQDVEFIETDDPIALQIIAIWEDLLKVKVGINHNFFHNGGHSLTAVQLSNRLRELFLIDVPIKAIFTNPTVGELSQFVQTALNNRSLYISSELGFSNGIPLTFSQQRLWFLDNFLPIKQTYNIPLAILLNGHINLPFLQEAFSILAERQQVLRTSISSVNSQPIQIIHNNSKINFSIVQVDEPYQPDKAQLHFNSEFETPFLLEQAPLWRGKLIQFIGQQQVLTLTIHHIIADAWSLRIFLQELASIYNAILQHKPINLPVLPRQYSSFAQWQRTNDWIKTNQLESQLFYWYDVLKNSPELVTLPSFNKRKSEQNYRGQRSRQQISMSLYKKMEIFVKQNHLTLFALLMTALHTLIARLNQQSDILVGFPVHNRHYPDVENLIGFFSNTLVLRSTYLSQKTFLAYLKEINESLLNAQSNQDIPFELLVDKLHIKRSLSQHPLFQIMLVLQDNMDEVNYFDGLKGESIAVSTETAKFDVLIAITKHQTFLTVDYEFLSDLFNNEFIEQIHHYFCCLMEDALENPHQVLGKLTILPKTSIEQLLNQFNKTDVVFPDMQCLHELVFRQAQMTPQSTAILHSQIQLNYTECIHKVHQFSHVFYQNGFKKGDVLLVCLPRSQWVVISLLSLLALGVVYVPVEPDFPLDRINYMIHNSFAKALLTDSCLSELAANLNLQSYFLDDIVQSSLGASINPLNLHVSPYDLACIIYTSGSTGQPKGVECTHRGLVNRILWMQSRYKLFENDRVLYKTPLIFDVANWELFWPLMVGAQHVVAPPDIHRDAIALEAFIEKYTITVIHFVPTMMRAFLQIMNKPGCHTLRYVFSSGEALTADLIISCRRLLVAELHNLYGPTEASIDVTHWSCADLKDTDEIVPIGKPIANTRIYILDELLNLVPIGVAGEIYLSGIGLARGYVNRDDLTKTVFLSNPFSNEINYMRMYKTGDLGRYLPDGNIEYLGRSDQQIKLRGFRIELGEIEYFVKQFPVIDDAVVLLRRNLKTEQYEIGVYFCSNSTYQGDPIGEMRHVLQCKLPGYMQPQYFVRLNELPLLASGKVDRQKLMLSEINSPSNKNEILLKPRNSIEKILSSVWQEILGVDQIDVRDNFFNLGGDSILCIHLVSHLRQYDLFIAVADIFRYPTIEDLAIYLRVHPTTSETASIDLDKIYDANMVSIHGKIIEFFSPALLQLGMIFHSNLATESPVYQDVFSYELYAPCHQYLFSDALMSICAQHPMLRSAFHIGQGGSVFLAIYEDIKPQLLYFDLSYMDEALQASNLRKWLEQEKNMRFDLYCPPLIRFSLHNLGHNKLHFGFSFHHAILDGWSVASMVTQILKAYDDLLQHKLICCPKLKSTYKNFVALEQMTIQDTEQKEFWLQQLDGAVPLKILPLTKTLMSSSKNNDYRSHYIVDLEGKITFGLDDLAKKLSVQAKHIMLAAHVWVLSRLYGSLDITTGYLVNTRLEEQDGDQVLGLFLNMLPLRIIFSGGTWLSLVQYISILESELQAHRRYPLAEITKITGNNALLNTSFSYVNFHIYQNLSDTIYVKIVNSVAYEQTNFELSANFYKGNQTRTYCLELEYDPQIFDIQRIHLVAEYYREALQKIVSHPQSYYQNESLLGDKEYEQLRIFSSALNIETKLLQVSILPWFSKYANTNLLAVIDNDLYYDYNMLNCRSNKLAHYLLSLGVSSQQTIAVYMQRSIDSVISLLAILKIGAIYLPLDLKFPAQRCVTILKACNCQWLLTQDEFISAWNLPENIKLLPLNTLHQGISNMAEFDPVVEALKPEDIAYIIFTSGSTGQPKGVKINHQALAVRIEWLQQQFCLTIKDRILQQTSVGFDVSLEEFLWPLSCGASLVIAPPSLTYDIAKYLNFIQRYQISVLELVPTILHLLNEHGGLSQCQCLRQILIGGESLPLSMLRHYYQNTSIPLVNLYGPTEATINVTYHQCSLEDLNKFFSYVPIGKPITNTQLYILDDLQNPLPVGTVGELYIAGPGLATGYIDDNDEEINFIYFENILCPWQRYYKTGDLVRFLFDGAIEFIGRRDQQIKRNGQRIDINEIESTLMLHPVVSMAITTTEQMATGQTKLFAYLQLANTITCANVFLEDITTFLLNKLPAYMLPNEFFVVDKLPLTVQGKIDKNQLKQTKNYALKEIPREDTVLSENEKRLFIIWSAVLDSKSITVSDNIFALGGDSLSITHILMQVQQQFMQHIDLQSFLRNPTLACMASLLSGSTPMYQAMSSCFDDLKLTNLIKIPYSERKNDFEKKILLTGATGLIGIHLLNLLTAKKDVTIYCLVRAENIDLARRKLLAMANQYGLHFFQYAEERIQIIIGEIQEDHFGLSQEVYQYLCFNIDTIYHCAAYVHHVFDYQQMRATNVLGTLNIIHFAQHGNLKLINYLSTVSITEFVSELSENFLTDESIPIGEGGYAQTKWVAEKLLASAYKMNYPINIFRLGLVAGHSSGYWHVENQHVPRLLLGGIQMGALPNWNLSFELLPVDYVSNAILNLSQAYHAGSHVFHLVHPKPIAWRDVLAILEMKNGILIIEEEAWKKHYLRYIDETNWLYPLASLYIMKQTPDVNQMVSYQASKTSVILETLNIGKPKGIHTLIRNYLLGWEVKKEISLASRKRSLVASFEMKLND